MMVKAGPLWDASATRATGFPVSEVNSSDENPITVPDKRPMKVASQSRISNWNSRVAARVRTAKIAVVR